MSVQTPKDPRVYNQCAMKKPIALKPQSDGERNRENPIAASQSRAMPGHH